MFRYSISGNGARRAFVVVELALVGLMLFSLILGTVEVGRRTVVEYLLLQAARQACELGVEPGQSTASITTAANHKLASDGIQGATVTVLVNGVPGEAETAARGDRIAVAIRVPASQRPRTPFARYLAAQLTAEFALPRQ
jgi:hypothetical protein